MNLELGCGRNPSPGFVHHDRTKHTDFVDVVHDLDLFPWPWPDKSCDVVLALDVFEHLQAMPIRWLAECHRILRSTGTLQLRVPVFGGLYHIADPTHVRGFHPLNFDYFIAGRDLRQRYGCYYADFVFSDGTVTLVDNDLNLVAVLTK